MNKVLFLPSWYPSRLDAFTGDFIQRHARALALFTPVHVVFIVRDKKKLITNSIKIEENRHGNLAETIVYYACKEYGFHFIDKLIAMRKYRSVYRQYFLQLQPDLFSALHVHVPYKAGLIALWLKKKYQLEYYVTEHWVGYDNTNTDNFFSRSATFRYITRKILSNAKIVISVSEDLARKLKGIADGINTMVIPNVVNEQLFYLELPVSKIFRFVHYASSWKGQKNTEALIRVLSELNNVNDGWECVMYGPAENELSELARKLGLSEKIKFTGEVPYEKVAEIVRAGSSFVSFSNYENQPCSILEALCCGLPVIATRVGGVPEIINTQNGILVDPKNEPGLLQALKTMIQTYDSYDRDEIANDARQKFSYNTVGKQLLSLYKS
jgi:glycosyltransferase involved in cell wall biosynthesis